MALKPLVFPNSKGFLFENSHELHLTFGPFYLFRKNLFYLFPKLLPQWHFQVVSPCFQIAFQFFPVSESHHLHGIDFHLTFSDAFGQHLLRCIFSYKQIHLSINKIDFHYNPEPILKWTGSNSLFKCTI